MEIDRSDVVLTVTELAYQFLKFTRDKLLGVSEGTEGGQRGKRCGQHGARSDKLEVFRLEGAGGISRRGGRGGEGGAEGREEGLREEMIGGEQHLVLPSRRVEGNIDDAASLSRSSPMVCNSDRYSHVGSRPVDRKKQQRIQNV
eukprot:757389-Hanusia_phi.AAC.2